MLRAELAATNHRPSIPCPRAPNLATSMTKWPRTTTTSNDRVCNDPVPCYDDFAFKLIVSSRETHPSCRFNHRPSLPTSHSPLQPSFAFRHLPRTPPRFTIPSRPLNLSMESCQRPLHLWCPSGYPHHFPRCHRLTSPSCMLRRAISH